MQKMENLRRQSELFLSRFKDVAQNFSGRLRIHGDGIDRLKVFDPAKKTEIDDGVREGQFYVSLPPEIAEVFPGSVLGPETYLKHLGLDDETVRNTSVLLLSQNLKVRDEAVLDYENDTMTLKVINGSFTEPALEMTKLAARNEFLTNKDSRAQYQKHLFQIEKEILSRTSDASFEINEDCIASGETIVGILETLKQKTKIRTGNKIAINVNVATTQGLLLIEEYARENGLQLDIVVGYLGYGLSSGEKIEGNDARKHANYIVYPTEILDILPDTLRQELRKSQDKDGQIFVVGDMGDASKSLPEEDDTGCPWNAVRVKDPWGERSKNEKEEKLTFDEDKRTRVVFPNGGYLQEAFKECLNPEDQNFLKISGKRVWTPDPDLGYGVLIDGIEKDLLKDQ